MKSYLPIAIVHPISHRCTMVKGAATRRATLRGLEMIEGIKAEQAQTTPQERGR